MSELELFVAEVLSELEDATFSLNFATSGLGVLVYVLQALALYTIAKRRGINKPWLAWIPLVNVWILGSISDQYQYVVKRQVKNKRKALLGLNIAISALAFVIIVGFVWLLIKLVMLGITMDFGWIDNGNPVSDIPWELVSNEIGALLLLAFSALPLMVLSIVHAVFSYMALYDVFRSCDPNNSTLFLILSLVGNVVVEGAYSIFLILCKDKDLGMPPRKEEPVAIPVSPVERDPWENAEE